MGRFIDATLRLIDNFTKPLGTAVTKMEQSSRQFQRAGKQIQKAGDSISGMGSKLTKAVSVPIVGLGVTAIKTAADFESAMSNVQAISGASAEDLGKLTDKAKEMGAKTKFSATESADAFSYMAMAGWKTKDMLNGIEGVMYLAGATGENLASTSDIVTDALTAFGMSASETNRFVDVLAKTASNSNTDVGMMGETFKYVAPVAGALKYSVEDVSLAIGLMANSGIKASNSGTALRGLLTNLAKPSDTVAAAMKKLGISLTDSSGEMKPLSSLMREMKGAFSGLTEAERAQYAAALAGKTGMSGLLAIVNSSDKDFDKLTQSIQNSNGAAKEMYDVANNNLTGRLTVLKSTLESIAITFGEKLMPYVEKGVGKLQDLAEKFGSLSDEQVSQIVKWAGMAVAIGPVIGLFGKTVSFAGGVVSGIGKIGGSISGLKGNAEKAKGVLSTIKIFPNFKMPKAFSGIGKMFSGIGKLGGVVMKPFSLMGNAIMGVASKSKILGFAGKAVSKYFSGFGKIAGFVLSPFKKVIGIFGTVGKAMFTFLGPVNSAIVIVAALVAGGILLYKNWNKISAAAGKLGGYIKSVFEACGLNMDFFKEKIGIAGGKFAEFAGKAQELWTVISPVLAKFGEIIRVVFVTVLGGSIGAAIGLFGSLFSSASEIFSGIMTILGGITDFITGVFTGNWEKAWSGIQDIFKGVFDSFVALAKMPINGVIGIINGAISGINKLGFKLPDWLGGKEFKINIPKIPMLYRGTSYWQGGPAMIHDRGAEIVDLPRGTRVYPHDESIRKAREEGKRSVSIQVAKIADTVIIREEADVDRIIDRFSKKLEAVAYNMA